MITNKRTKKELSNNYKKCRSYISKSIGLMFSLRPKTLIFEFRKEKKIPLHMCFVFFPIDVLWLDSKKNVVELKENFMPFTFYNPKKNAKYVIELKAGQISQTGTKIGDEILIS